MSDRFGGPRGPGRPPRDVAPVGIVVRERFLDEPTLAAVQEAMRRGNGQPAEVRADDSDELVRDSAARVAWEVPLPDELHGLVVDRIDALRPDLERFIDAALEPCDGVAALRYPTGAFYGPHRDVADSPHPEGLHRRLVSVVIFVNDGAGPRAEFGGGCLRFYGLGGDQGVVDVAPEAGALVAFPSGLRHEVTPVTWGERYTVVTWLLGTGRAS